MKKLVDATYRKILTPLHASMDKASPETRSPSQNLFLPEMGRIELYTLRFEAMLRNVIKI